MAKSNPNIPLIDITLATPVNQYVLQGTLISGPISQYAGAGFAGIFAPDCIIQDYNGSGVYIMSGTTAVPAWTSIGSPFGITVESALGTVQNSTPTAAQLITGLVTQTGATGAGTVTLPIGTLLSAAVPGVVVGSSFSTVFQNLGGGQTLTITGATGTTVIGTAAVPSGKGTRLLFVNTGTGTWNVYINLSA